VEHAQILDLQDLPRFAALGIVASMQPVHCTSDLDWVEARLGSDRGAGGYAWRSLLDSGARICFGTDFPVEDVDPLAGLYAARTRQHQDGTPPGGWHPEQRLDGRTALRLYTAGGAYAAFAEDKLGEVAPGRLADLTVLTGDPTVVAPAELLKLRPLLTVVAGRIRFDGRELTGP
jgi:predicted amidohydrolase YtcJ